MRAIVIILKVIATMNQKPSQNLTLYIGATCPFCHKVLNFIQAHHIELPVVDVWSSDKAMQKLIKLSGKKQVPCLQVDDTPLLESDDIIIKLKQIYQV